MDWNRVWHCEGATDKTPLKSSTWSRGYRTTMVPLALNRAAKYVIEAEEGGAEEEESRGEIIVETESRIVYNC